MQKLRYLLLPFFLIHLTSCGTSKYESYLFPLEAEMIAPDSEFIPMRVASGKSATLKIHSEKNPRKIKTLPGGILKVPLTREYIDENPDVTLWPPGKLTFVGTFHLEGKKENAKEFIKIDQMEKTQIGNTTVFYKPNDQKIALRFLKRSQKHADIVKKVTGFEATPWGLTVVPRFKKNTAYWVSGHTNLFSVWSYERADLHNGDFDGTNTHEWIENTIGKNLDLHSADKEGRNRILIDGLADYGDYLITGKIDNISSVKDLIKSGVKKMNLLEDFQSIRLESSGVFDTSDIMGDTDLAKKKISAGYALSCLFWIQLTEKYGTELPQQFCQAIQKKSRRNFPSCLATLEKLTGEKDLTNRLSNVDLQKALTSLNKLTK